VRARGGELAGDLGEGGCAGEEGRKEKGGADARARAGSERKERRGRSGWGKRASVRPTRGKTGERRERARGRKWARGREAREGERERGSWAGPRERLGCLLLFLLPSLFFFFTLTIQTKPFEFKQI
jgi:hypothetical protein